MVMYFLNLDKKVNNTYLVKIFIDHFLKYPNFYKSVTVINTPNITSAIIYQHQMTRQNDSEIMFTFLKYQNKLHFNLMVHEELIIY